MLVKDRVIINDNPYNLMQTLNEVRIVGICKGIVNKVLKSFLFGFYFFGFRVIILLNIRIIDLVFIIFIQII